MPIAARLTAEEYLALPESPPGVRFELLDGELVTMNDPLVEHQDAAGAIWAALREWCRAAPGRGRATLSIDTRIGPQSFFGPDVQWYAGHRELPSKRERPWPIGDIVVEVASASTRRYDAEVKVPRYLAAGAQEVWLVGTEPLGGRILRAGAGSVLLGPADALTSPLLPGFALPLVALND